MIDALPLAVYGTLRHGGEAVCRFPGLTLIGPCVLRGRLHRIDWYPGLVDRNGQVRGDLFELSSPETLSAIDAYERYDPENPDGSLYLRRRMRLIEPDREAWVYIYNRTIDEAPIIESGDWLATAHA